MSLAAVQNAVFKRLQQNPIPGWPCVGWPNVNAPAQTDNHLRATVLSVPKEAVGLGFAGAVRERYIIQIDVMGKTGIGATKPAEAVQAVLALFSRGLRITDGSETVHIDQPGSETSPIPGSAWFQIPVSIPCYIL